MPRARSVSSSLSDSDSGSGSGTSIRTGGMPRDSKGRFLPRTGGKSKKAKKGKSSRRRRSKSRSRSVSYSRRSKKSFAIADSIKPRAGGRARSMSLSLSSSVSTSGSSIRTGGMTRDSKGRFVPRSGGKSKKSKKAKSSRRRSQSRSRSLSYGRRSSRKFAIADSIKPRPGGEYRGRGRGRGYGRGRGRSYSRSRSWGVSLGYAPYYPYYGPRYYGRRYYDRRYRVFAGGDSDDKRNSNKRSGDKRSSGGGERSGGHQLRNSKGQFVAKSRKHSRSVSRRGGSSQQGGVTILRTVVIVNPNDGPYWVRMYETREGTFSSAVQSISKPLGAPMLVQGKAKVQYAYSPFGWAPGITGRVYWRKASTSEDAEGKTLLPDAGPSEKNLYTKRVRVGVTDVNIHAGGESESRIGGRYKKSKKRTHKKKSLARSRAAKNQPRTKTGRFKKIR